MAEFQMQGSLGKRIASNRILPQSGRLGHKVRVYKLLAI
jgi:hypothetical protein